MKYVIQYVQHTKPSVEVNTYFPLPNNLKKYIDDAYVLPKKLIKKNLVGDLVITTILIFNNVEDLYQYNTDPMLASWRIEHNEFLVKLGVVTIQGAGYYEITAEELNK